MENIRKLFRNSIITTVIFGVLTLISQNIYILIGLVSGCIISILSLYMLSTDVKNIVSSGDEREAKKIAYFGFTKRYCLYLVYLGVMIYFLGFSSFIAGAVGLFNVKMNIYILVVLEKFEKIRNKYLHD